MNCLLLGGASNVGKTTAIYNITKLLVSKGFKYISDPNNPFDPTKVKDFTCLFEGQDKKGSSVKIVVNSGTDLISMINSFGQFYEAQNQSSKCDILISSIRDEGCTSERNNFFSTISINQKDDFILEIPFGKVRKGEKRNRPQAIIWYQKKMEELIIHILKNSPFDLNL